MTTDNEFADERPGLALKANATPTTAANAADVNRAIAEVQAMVIVAQRFPRDQIKARDRILQAFTRPKLAQAGLYQYARAGTNIIGPSIRAAEAIAREWGNMKFGIRELEQRYGESTVEAFSWDLETNVQESRVFHVSHKIGTKKGMKVLEDPRDIYELSANQGARRMRACILALIPSDVVDDIVIQIDKTLRASINITPAYVQSMIEKFEAIGVPKSALEANLQRHLNVSTLTPALAIRLSSIYNSINDGMSLPTDYFDIAQPAETPATGSRVDQAVQLLEKQKGTIETPFEPKPAEDKELELPCEACGAKPGEPCAADCLAKADESGNGIEVRQ